MKKVFLIVSALLSISLASSASDKNTLVYNKTSNPVIGINVDLSQSNTDYIIKSVNGKIIKKGTVKGKQRITLNTQNLKAGTYIFELNGETQEFIIE